MNGGRGNYCRDVMYERRMRVTKDGEIDKRLAKNRRKN